MKLIIDDVSAPTPEHIYTTAQRWHMEDGLDLLLVDHIQHMSDSPNIRRGSNDAKAVGYRAKMLKNLARELNIPIIAAVQLSRKVEERADKRPMLSDLRESGELEQEADIVMFVYRGSKYDAAIPESAAEWIVAKHRNGPTATVPMYWNKNFARFQNAEGS